MFPEIIQLIIICQMCALSAWALRLYKRPDKYEIPERISERDAGLLDKGELLVQKGVDTQL